MRFARECFRADGSQRGITTPGVLRARRVLPLLLGGTCMAQTIAALAGVTTIDTVEVKDGHIAEALYYYENNWSVYRAIALERGYISGYRLLRERAEDGGDRLLLITDYPDEESHARREENFAPIMPEDGSVKLLNSIPPVNFRTVSNLGTFEFN